MQSMVSRAVLAWLHCAQSGSKSLRKDKLRIAGPEKVRENSKGGYYSSY
jgi:hypothetical protein